MGTGVNLNFGDQFQNCRALSKNEVGKNGPFLAKMDHFWRGIFGKLPRFWSLAAKNGPIFEIVDFGHQRFLLMFENREIGARIFAIFLSQSSPSLELTALRCLAVLDGPLPGSS